MAEEKTNEMFSNPQFSSLAILIANGEQRTHESIKEMKREITGQIGDVHKTLKEHNGRIREEEERRIRLEEQNRIRDEKVEENKMKILKQRTVCQASKLEVKNLQKIEKALSWISKHPYQTITYIVTSMLILLEFSDVIYHIFISRL